ncbi:uncharacterized protein LOC129321259 [Prosopis cineraria]|uniref:uncharacterized protein LOC129321259 n=1 Tax=Prosopis cineraria TaxID=364024 RepID=UPI00240F0A09|nr:uncharacterized protein LOC129321259 [Prosopis cineraria]
MHRKRSLLFQKVSSLLKTPLLVPKLRKPIIPKLLLLKRFKKRKDFKLLMHYNNGFHGEYQFSPSSTPLIRFHRTERVKNRVDYRDLCSLLFLVRCLGDFRAEVKGFNGGFGERQLEEDLSVPATGDGEEDLCEPLDSDDGDESVDQKAERFIERFYREMKLQRQDSI